MKTKPFAFALSTAGLLLAACGSNESATLPIYGTWTAAALNRTEGEMSERATVTLEKGLTRFKKVCTVGKESVTVEIAAKSEFTADRWRVLEPKFAEKMIQKLRCEANIEVGEVSYKVTGDKLVAKDLKRNEEQTMTRVK